jgi:predicted RNA binding protein YcfA (HicA-like mRNA interferase family)
MLAAYGYTVTRQAGSHLRLTTQFGGEHHITIPKHQQLRIGTLAQIIGEVAEHCGIEREELIRRLS